MDRRTLTMNWDGLGEEDDDDRFFESYSRISSVTPLDMASSGSDDEEFEDGRVSFASCVSSASFASVGTFKNLDGGLQSSSVLQDYGMWMAEPGDINERRKRLLQGMGLASNKGFLKLASARIVPTVSFKVNTPQDSTSKPESSSPKEPKQKNMDEPAPESLPSTAIVLIRSRSDGDIHFFSLSAKKRKEQLIGPASKQRLTRTSSLSIAKNIGLFHYANSERVSRKNNKCRSLAQSTGEMSSSLLTEGGFGSFFLIKNLDTGKEFVVKESNEKGMWNKLSDLETGKQLTMEEFEKTVGHSPVVKEMMRREKVLEDADDCKKDQANSYLTKSFRNSKRRGVALLKNLREVANSMGGLIADKERENSSTADQKATKNSSQWVKVRQHGKPYKELTALHLSQEIQAHEGSIWTIKFSSDSRYLASAGEDKVIHVWEVQDCEVMSARPPDDLNSVSGTPVHPMAGSIPERPPLAEISPVPSERRKKGKYYSKKKGNSMPDYVSMPETVFALSEKPVCTFTGHLDDVLDLSWSGEQLLLSSSTDKTVRLWDLETGRCLKLFAHNDYGEVLNHVKLPPPNKNRGHFTCIQFNPVDGDYFISGSLDSKVRIWNVSDRQVVDWIDLHEMVTSASYTPDGQGAIFGCHKGSCRLYTIDDYKLEHKEDIEIRNKKKSQSKKVTGIQFSPCNPGEILLTSADSRIRIAYGSEIIHKFKGFRNTSSQITASFTPDGKYIVSASEDNQVFMWKWEYPKNVGSGKCRTRTISQAYEHFQCKDVSVAIPWEGSIKNEAPIVEMHSKRHYSKRFISQPQPSPEDSKRQLPPLPKKENNLVESISGSPDDEFAQSSRIDPGISASDSFASASSSSIRYGDSPSISTSGNSHSQSQSWSSSWSLFDGSSSQGSPTVQATAWGMVIVTATLGGEIRVYQNFGLPLKVGRPTNLFKDLT